MLLPSYGTNVYSTYALLPICIQLCRTGDPVSFVADHYHTVVRVQVDANKLVHAGLRASKSVSAPRSLRQPFYWNGGRPTIWLPEPTRRPTKTSPLSQCQA